MQLFITSASPIGCEYCHLKVQLLCASFQSRSNVCLLRSGTRQCNKRRPGQTRRRPSAQEIAPNCRMRALDDPPEALIPRRGLAFLRLCPPDRHIQGSRSEAQQLPLKTSMCPNRSPLEGEGRVSVGPRSVIAKHQACRGVRQHLRRKNVLHGSLLHI